MKTARQNLLDAQAADVVNDEARLANDIQRQLPGATRTWALREAARIVRQYGLGCAIEYRPYGLVVDVSAQAAALRVSPSGAS